ncbi:MAG: hypothetical protein FIB00_11080 [Chloroflexi bacterium]|nr:hypothetical protein [Chloroflexota bacterium]
MPHLFRGHIVLGHLGLVEFVDLKIPDSWSHPSIPPLGCILCRQHLLATEGCPMMPDVGHPRIEFLVLADRAEVSGGKLYMMGGCWDRVQLPALEPRAMFPAGVAMRVLVAIDDLAGYTVSLSLTGPGEPTIVPNKFQFLRDVQIPADQPSPLAVLIASECFLGIKSSGVHRLRATIDGGDFAETRFLVTIPEPSARAVAT